MQKPGEIGVEMLGGSIERCDHADIAVWSYNNHGPTRRDAIRFVCLSAKSVVQGEVIYEYFRPMTSESRRDLGVGANVLLCRSDRKDVEYSVE